MPLSRQSYPDAACGPRGGKGEHGGSAGNEGADLATSVGEVLDCHLAKGRCRSVERGYRRLWPSPQWQGGSGRIETQAKGSVVTAIRGAHRSVRSLSTVLNWKAKQVLECCRRAISMWFKSASIVALPNFSIAPVAAAKLNGRSSRRIGAVIEARWRRSLIWTSLRSRCQHGW